jgi:hypothetical protein
MSIYYQDYNSFYFAIREMKAVNPYYDCFLQMTTHSFTKSYTMLSNC